MLQKYVFDGEHAKLADTSSHASGPLSRTPAKIDPDTVEMHITCRMFLPKNRCNRDIKGESTGTTQKKTVHQNGQPATLLSTFSFGHVQKYAPSASVSASGIYPF